MMNKRACLLLCILSLLLASLAVSGSQSVFGGGFAMAADVPAAAQAELVETPEVLWEKATAAQEAADHEKASGYFRKFYEHYRDNDKAEEALWLAARNAKEQALASKSPDWEKVRNLFRMYTTDFPEAARSPEAYFEVGLSHYHMRFFREALIYFKLFAQRYPASPLLPKVRFWQARTLFTIGRLDEAAALYQDVAKTADADLKVKALMGLGDTHDAKKDYAAALATFTSLLRKYPDYYLGDPELLRKLGTAYLKVGQEDRGRKYLYHYLNLAEKTPLRGDVLFDLAESYFRQGDKQTALKLYGNIVETGSPQDRAVVLARFRQAEYLDDPDKNFPEWKKRGDLKNPDEDRPFLAVLDGYHAEPIAQDARRALFLRYAARENFEYALEVGKSYLRNDEPGLQAGEKEDFSNRILLYLGDGLLAQKQYEKLYQLYVTEHRHVSTLNNGRFLYLVGQALEALSLHDQAAVVYYRALALPLSDTDKVNLYFRRAEVYLALKNYTAADRLLKYLRDIYKNSKEVGEIFYLSGRLAEEQGKKAEALDYYTKAAAVQTFAEKKPVYGQARLRMLYGLGLFDEMLDALGSYRKEQWLSAEELQTWYRRVGDELRRKDEKKTFAAYLAAVSENMPQEGEAAQHIHLHLGDLYFKMGEKEKGRDHLFKATKGPDPLLTKRAKERLNQIDIEEESGSLNRLLGRP